MRARGDRLRLMSKNSILGQMTYADSDMPSLIYKFTPTHDFERLRYLFEAEVEALGLAGTDSDEWRELHAAILDLNLRIVDEDTSAGVPFWWVHVAGDKAWYVPR